jgi:hypothetical protein
LYRGPPATAVASGLLNQGSPATATFTSVEARHVRVQLEGTDFLSVAEARACLGGLPEAT